MFYIITPAKVSIFLRWRAIYIRVFHRSTSLRVQSNASRFARANMCGEKATQCAALNNRCVHIVTLRRYKCTANDTSRRRRIGISPGIHSDIAIIFNFPTSNQLVVSPTYERTIYKKKLFWVILNTEKNPFKVSAQNFKYWKCNILILRVVRLGDILTMIFRMFLKNFI